MCAHQKLWGRCLLNVWWVVHLSKHDTAMSIHTSEILFIFRKFAHVFTESSRVIVLYTGAPPGGVRGVSRKFIQGCLWPLGPPPPRPLVASLTLHVCSCSLTWFSSCSLPAPPPALCPCPSSRLCPSSCGNSIWRGRTHTDKTHGSSPRRHGFCPAFPWSPRCHSHWSYPGEDRCTVSSMNHTREDKMVISSWKVFFISYTYMLVMLYI